MDFGFAPGVSVQDGQVRTLFSRRAGTTLDSIKRLLTLQGFVTHLGTSASVTRPIDDALLGAHANSEGWIFIPMFPGQGGGTNFETLEEALATASHPTITADPVFDPAHDDHWFKRLGYASLADFFVGYTWSHSAKRKGLHT